MSWQTVPLHDAPFSSGQQVYTGWSPGDVKLTARSTAESGWLLCDGSQYLPTTYPALYDAIGTTFNTGGETAGYFRVPDMNGRTPVGVSKTDGDFDLGDQSGAKTHEIAAAELPAHTHHVYRHNYVSAGSGGGASLAWDSQAGYNAQSETSSIGSGTAMSLLQPGLALNFEIKL